MNVAVKKEVSLCEIAWLFFVIGTTGFGGGLAIVAYVQEQCVIRRKWLTLDEFSHGVALGQILGAFAVNTTVFVGYRLRGLAGAITAFIAFLSPSIALIMILAGLYSRFSHLSLLQAALRGIGPVVVALIVNAAYQMGRARVKNLEPALISIVAFILLFFVKLPVFWILLITAVYGIIRYRTTPAAQTPDEPSYTEETGSSE